MVAQDRAASKTVVFIAGTASHGYGAHEHYAGCKALAANIQQAMPNVRCEVIRNGWPQDDSILDSADTIVIYADGGNGHPAMKHLDRLRKLCDRGVGLVCLHYGVEVPKGEAGDTFLACLGGYFEINWSVNPHWTAEYKTLPKHPIANGVVPFSANDEWYFHMRFRPNMEGVTPILSAIAPASTMERPDGEHSGNPTVRKAVANGEPQHTAWAFERSNGGRSFGFSGGHDHWNWGRPDMLRLVSNAIVWTAKVEIPSSGITTPVLNLEQLKANQDEPVPANFDFDRVAEKFKLVAAVQAAGDVRSPEMAVAGLTVHPGVVATLAASEPALKSLTNIDIDHRGRIWVCEVVNYRKHNGERPEGDRILILEDNNQDGVVDTSKVFYQGRDVDSAMGICVLGNKVIVSATPNIWLFTDENGDDIPDKKEALFTKTGRPQHDHSAHSFLFGPDGKMYWNFGNEGHQMNDAQGNPVKDRWGRPINDSGKPYREGMVFRCNFDGSDMEVLGNNFRNNYETAVDSFGAIWQSDNDDDGNRATRINFVMEFGNYGYKDERTGAGWQAARTNMETEIPLKHWHLNDPGVVPTMLITGAGSPTGITIYEGNLLPKDFQNQILHCDAGPNVVRAYPTKRDGAGYSADIVNLMVGEIDKWFRPADVCVAPDGSVFISDWYDPGVGGHNMLDMERGRLFRVAPKDAKYVVPKFDFANVDSCIEAMKNPNLSIRYMAWQALHAKGREAESALLKLWQDPNPRNRARALWLLGKIEGRGEFYVTLALKDSDADIRSTGIRLARQLKMTPKSYASPIISDASPAVRRELLVALREDTSPEMPGLWAQLARQHDGKDRWYLEALGIGAMDRWDDCIGAWLALVGEGWNTPSGRDILWRSRSAKAGPKIVEIIKQGKLAENEIPRYFRAVDFLQDIPGGISLESLLDVSGAK